MIVDMDMNVGSWLIRRSVLSGDKISVIDEDVRLSFKGLNRRVNAVANMFLRKGLKKGDRVAALLMNCHQFLEIYFLKIVVFFSDFVFLPLGVWKSFNCWSKRRSRS
jgi:acyl-CoA synthetase (AMP-forming)/AMP-acid ligase II